MTVAELREYLREFPGHLEVILSSDSEGNKFSPLEEASVENYSSEDNEIFAVDVDDDEESDSDVESFTPDGVDEALIIWPTT